MTGSRRVKILQITSYPPPRAGWGVRVEFLKKRLESEGHVCTVLNIGRSRTIPSPEYETVRGARDYVRKVWRFSRDGFVVHMHVNGDSPKGFVLSLLAEGINLFWGKRCLLTFHAGVEQIYFPRPKYPWLLPMYWLLFAIPRRIICNSAAVKAKIVEYNVPDRKVVPIPAFSTQYVDRVDTELPPTVADFFAQVSNVLFTYIRIRPGFYLDAMIDGFAKIAAVDSSVGLAVCGLSGDIDAALLEDLNDRIRQHGLADRICLIDDLSHDEFLEALSRSALYLRTPTTDGVASSVLESLSLGVPVVGSENGSRPPGVITYSAADPSDLAAKVLDVLANRTRIVASMPRPPARDTLAEEVSVLTA
jgi:glycosyltransferase involved in cell wall biosynthesis